MSEQCKYHLAWIGRCKNLAIENIMCEEHKNEKCISCGKPATRQCSETGQFVCGAPLCDDCEHTTYPSGTNGGIGFFGEKLPEGMKEHCKKTEQKYFSWMAKSLADEYPEVAEILKDFDEGKTTYTEADELLNSFLKN